MVLPVGGVKLADGSVFPPQRTLNYDLPVKDFSVDAGQRLPVAVTLAAPLTIPANTVLGGPVLAADGALLYAAGTLLGEAVTLPANARLGAGFVTPAQTAARPCCGGGRAAGGPHDVEWRADAEDGRAAAVDDERQAARRSDGAAAAPGRRPGQHGTQLLWPRCCRPDPNPGRCGAVAGADPTAADSRIARGARRGGNLILADSHTRCMTSTRSSSRPARRAVRSVSGIATMSHADLGGSHPELKLGQPVSDAVAAQCNDGVCEKVRYLWTEMGGVVRRHAGRAGGGRHARAKVWEEQVCADAGICSPRGRCCLARRRSKRSAACSTARSPARRSACCAPAPATWSCWPAAICMKSPFGVHGRHPGRRGRGLPACARAVSAEDGKVLDKRSQDYEKLVAATTGSTAPGIRSAAATCWCAPAATWRATAGAMAAMPAKASA